MTTIAWDGESLAADKLADCGYAMTTTKIRRTSDGRLLGASGDAGLARKMLDWLELGGGRPEDQKGKDDWVAVLEILPTGEIWRHERFGKFKIEDSTVAIGSGRDLAMAAMECGKTAMEAVLIASKFDTATGRGVDVLKLNA